MATWHVIYAFGTSDAEFALGGPYARVGDRLFRATQLDDGRMFVRLGTYGSALRHQAESAHPHIPGARIVTVHRNAIPTLGAILEALDLQEAQ